MSLEPAEPTGEPRLCKTPPFSLYDAHNHLQDERLRPYLSDIWDSLGPVDKMVVNGSCEEDWPAVYELAKSHPQVIPAFGYHPWYVKERTPEWKKVLVDYLDKVPSGVGEIGLDRWIKDYDMEAQEEVFVWQLRLAAERNLPVTIHCLQAWGRLLELLHRNPRPACGFLLHSFGGAAELIPSLVKLGAYFSLPGYFAHDRKGRQREAFKKVPLDRLLIETDAPDQNLPPERVEYPLKDDAGHAINHPGNIVAVYEFAAELLGQKPEVLQKQVAENFAKFIGPLGHI